MVGHVHQHASTAPAAESVWTFFSRLFHAEFVPRAQCYLLQPELIWLHVISDGLIAAAYFSIPLALIYFVKRRKDLAFHWMFILFAIFILACGTTHLFNILAVWHPMYRLDGVVKGATAVASVGTAIALWPLIPAAIALPSPDQLRTANTSLGAEVERRRLAEEGLRRAHDDLEGKVRQRTAELARSEGRLRAIVDTAVDAILTIDERGNIGSFNPAAERIFGYSVDEVLGRNINMLMPEPYRAEHDSYLENYARTAERKIIGIGREVQGRRKDGSVFPMDLAVSETRLDDGRVFTGIVRDITERKRSEEALARHRDHLNELVEQRTAELSASHARLRASERMASMGTLAAGLGHDLGNLLLPVRVRLERLAEEVPPQLRGDVATIRESTRYLGQLANGLRLLARDPESDAATMETIEVEEWWGGVAALMRSPFAGGVRLEVRIAANLPRIRIGRSSLTQAVFNLVQNAGDALRAGGGSGGTVEVWAEASSDGESVRVGVTDDGPGMSEEVRSRCLEPFYSTKTRGISTGLGLSLVKGIAERAGGSVSIRSAPGEGTTVSISLPALADEAADAATRDAAVSVADRRVRSFVSIALGPLGFAVTSNGAPGPATLLWVVDGSVPPAAISAFLDADPRRRVLVYGTPPAGLADTRLSSMEPVFQATAIREALTRAAREATQSP